MQLKALIVTSLALLTASAAPNNLPATNQNIEARAWSFYAGGGACLTG
jgi:hypothetical protein